MFKKILLTVILMLAFTTNALLAQNQLNQNKNTENQQNQNINRLMNRWSQAFKQAYNQNDTEKMTALMDKLAAQAIHKQTPDHAGSVRKDSENKRKFRKIENTRAKYPRRFTQNRDFGKRNFRASERNFRMRNFQPQTRAYRAPDYFAQGRGFAPKSWHRRHNFTADFCPKTQCFNGYRMRNFSQRKFNSRNFDKNRTPNPRRFDTPRQNDNTRRIPQNPRFRNFQRQQRPRPDFNWNW